jgi:hypothetical protein
MPFRLQDRLLHDFLVVLKLIKECFCHRKIVDNLFHFVDVEVDIPEKILAHYVLQFGHL